MQGSGWPGILPRSGNRRLKQLDSISPWFEIYQVNGSTFYPGMMYGHFDDSDFESYLRSMKHLVSLLGQVSHLCPAHNEAYVPKEMLTRTLEAFEQIATDKAPYTLEDSVRVYRFEGFGLLLPNG